MSMDTLELKKLSQAITNTKNKVKFCRIMCVEGLDEDEVDGLSLILADVVDEMEQAANTVDLLKPSEFQMKRKGTLLKAVRSMEKPNYVMNPENGNGKPVLIPA